MRFPLFFALILALAASLGVYVHRRVSAALGLARRGRRVFAALLVAGLAGMPLGRLARGLFPEVVQRAFLMVGSLLALTLLLTAILLGVFDLIRFFARAALRRFRRSVPASVPASAPASVSASVSAPVPASLSAASSPVSPVSRRDFLSQGAAGSAVLIGGGCSIYGALVGRHDYSIEEIQIPIAGLPRALEGFTIVQLSDVHLGLFVGEPEINAAVELVRKARGDLIALTGDLIDFDPRYNDLLGSLTRRLVPLAREGVVAIPGNHDYYAGIDGILSTLERGGADVLRNRGRAIGGPGGAFALLGVDDVSAAKNHVPGGGPDLAAAIATVPRDLPRVLLCHNPVFFPEAAGEVALQLSGHTHGGQINVLVRPADVVLTHGYIAGLYRRGASRIYVNRGFGTAGPPARIGAPPEVSRIVLVSG